MNHLSPLEAILATLDPKTPHQHRSISQGFLEDVKKSREGFAIVSNLLFHLELAPEVHLMCLTILHEWIKLWWIKLTLQDQLEVRSILSQLFSDISHGHRIVSNNFGSKLSSVLSEIAERHFPQHWESMISDFSVLWTQSSSVSAREIIVKTLQFLYSDCTDNDFANQLLASRRQEILSGLKLNEEIILNLSYQYLGANVLLLMNQPDETESRKNCTKSICLTMELLLSMMPVIQPTDLLKDERNFLLLLLKVLYFSETQILALQLLQHIFSYEYDLLLLPRIVEWVVVEKRIAFPSDKESFFAVVKSYAIAVLKLLSSNLKAFIMQHQRSNELLHFEQQLLSELLQCYEVESHRIVGETLVDFTKIYRYEKITEIPFAGALLEQLLIHFKRRCLKPDFLEKGERFYPEWFCLEFDDVEDFTSFHTVLLSHFIAFATAASEKFGSIVVAAMKQQLGSIMSSAIEPPTSLAMVLSQCQVLNSCLLHPCVPVIAKNLRSNQSLCLESYQIVDSIIQLQVSEISLLGYKFRFLLSVSSWLEFFHEERRLDVFLLLQQCLQIFRAVLTSSAGISRNDHEEVKFLSAIDQIGESFSGLIPKFLKFVSSDEVLLSLLNEVNDICQSFDLPVVKKHMREVLVTISEKAPNNFSLQRQILSVAFEKELERLSLLVDEAVSDSRRFEDSFFRDSPERGRSLVTMNEIFFSFTQAASKIQFPETWNASTWNDAGVTEQALLQAFPMAFLWKVLLEKTVRFLRHLYHMWSVEAFNDAVARSNGSASLLIRQYGPSHIDIKKYLKCKNQSQFTSKSKESLRSLLSTIYKTLGLACRQRVFYFLVNQADSTALIFSSPFSSRFLENWHFVLLNRYFLSSYFINIVPSAAPHATCALSQHCSFSLERFAMSWQGGNLVIPGSLLLESESQYLFLSHHQNFLFPQYDGLEAEQISTLKDNIKREVVRSFAELFGTIFGLRGPLATPNANVSSSEDSNLEKQERVLRRRELLSLYFSVPYRHQNSQLLTAFFPIAISILQLGDGAACKELVGVLTFLVYYSLRETDFIPFLATDVFREVLSVLLRSEGWTVGLEWELLELLLELYRVFVVGIDFKALHSQLPDLAAAFSLAEVESLPQATTQRPLHEGPRQCLLHTSLLSPEQVLKFEEDLQRIQSKKKQRDLMKDLVRTMISQIHDPAVLSQLGSSLLPKPVRANFSQKDQGRGSQTEPDLRQDLSSLFTA